MVAWALIAAGAGTLITFYVVRWLVTTGCPRCRHRVEGWCPMCQEPSHPDGLCHACWTEEVKRIGQRYERDREDSEVGG